MKVLENILKEEILSLICGKLDLLQSAYHSGRGVDDAKMFILDRIYKHLEKGNAHGKVLFVDFS